MDVNELHKLIDEWAAKQPNATVTFSNPEPAPPEPQQGERELPKDKRVVRTKTSGDKVYQLDEVKKQRQWVANDEVLTALGWSQADVVEIPDTELFKYSMGAALYRVE